MWAVKIIRKSAMAAEDKGSLEREVDIMERLSKLNHPNIVILREVFDATDNFYMVMELCTGGEVFDRIVEKEKYTEAEARVAVAQVAEGLRVCHSIGIVHRDLKPENLLYTSPDSDQIKLADFGLADILSPESALETACGTPGYVAPEILRGSGYGKEVDMWSLGVITYILLCGYPPFYDENQNKLFKKIRKGDFTFPPPIWNAVSEHAKHFVKSLLTVVPGQRLSAERVLKEPWILKPSSDEPILVGFQENLARYNAKRKFKAGVMKMQAINMLMGTSTTNANVGSL